MVEQDSHRRTDARRILIAVSLVAIAVILAWTCFIPFYDTNDDTVMRLIAEGRAVPGSGPEARLLFINAGIGLVLVAAYMSLPAWPWYDLVIVGLEGVAAIAITFVLLRQSNRGNTVALAVFVATFWMVSFVRLQFTVVAGHLAAAGCLLVGEMLVENDAARRFWITRGASAVALIALGGLVRWQAALLVVALATTLSIPIAVSAWRSQRRRAVRSALAALVTAIILVGGVIELDRRYYAAGPGWADYRAAHRLRGLITEGLPHTTDTEARLGAARHAAGWSPNDIEMLRSRFHTNLDIFGRDRLDPAVRRLQETGGSRTIFGYAPDDLPEVINDTLRRIWRESSYTLAVAMLLGLAFLRPGLIVYATYSTAVLLATLVLTSLAFKEIPFRVFWPLVTVQAALLILVAGSLVRRTTIIRAALIALAASVPAYAALHDLHRISVLRFEQAQRVDHDVQALPRMAGRTYLLHGSSFDYPGYFRPFVRSPPADAFEFLPLAATSQTPLVQDYLRREGIGDVALDLCTNDRFRLISDRDLFTVERYVVEHFGVPVTIEPEFTGQTFTSFRCTRRALASP